MFAQTLFNTAARSGAAALIAQVHAPLIADFARYAAPAPTDCVLDVGTGTGSLARLLAPQVAHVTGLDISGESLRVARALSGSHAIHWVQGDCERMPFAPGTFSLIAAHLGLNLTDPRRSIPALRRVLAPGGRIVVQEWGPKAVPLLAVDEVLSEYALDEPGEPLASLRAAVEAFPGYWYTRLQDGDDYREAFEHAGFSVTHVAELAPVTLRLPSVDAFLAYALADTVTAAEVGALPEERRAACLAELRTRLHAWVASDGGLTWKPVVQRLSARAECQRSE